MGDARPDGPGTDAEAALIAALHELAAVAAVDQSEPDTAGAAPRPDLTLTLSGGATVAVEVKALAHVGPAEARALIEDTLRGGNRAVVPLVVADRMTSEAKRLLAGSGLSFFDRRGRLVLSTGDRTIEADVTPAPRPTGRGAGPSVRGTSGLSAALAALLSPGEPLPVRETARAAALSHTAIAQARAKLRDAQLLDARFRPVLPELFEEVVAAWVWPAVTETVLPPPSDRLVRAAGAEWEGPYYVDLHALAIAVKADTLPRGRRDRHAGWALGGTHAAAAYGADVVVGADAPRNWIVPQDRYLTATRIESQGRARRENARLLAAPCRLAVRIRRKGPHDQVALAHPVVVAIELAQDPSRGREILETFEPGGVPVVWR